ncbi:LysR family transcriptional regulator [Amycolatopsis thermoflava]|uniref:LysR family transcriptional regulator n=1 Tax=Amycolatopsis thermoflava TaxID=84480 RepID=UPI003666B191
MERRQLEYFLAVVEHGGFTNAARALHVAQPSLSHAIRGLELELGGSLFHRLPHGTRLTPAGHALVGPARQVMRDLSTAASSVREVLGLSGGTLDIVAQTTLAVDPLATLLGRYRTAHPKVVVRVVDPESPADVVQRVRSGASEVGLVSAHRVDGHGLCEAALPEQELLLVLPPSAEPPPGGAMGREQLAELDLVAPRRGTATRDMVEQALAELSVEPRVAVETDHRAMIIPLVLAGAGAALLPRSMAEQAALQGAIHVGVRPRLLRRGALLWRSGPLSPAAAAFVDLLDLIT